MLKYQMHNTILNTDAICLIGFLFHNSSLLQINAMFHSKNLFLLELKGPDNWLLNYNKQLRNIFNCYLNYKDSNKDVSQCQHSCRPHVKI